MESPGEQQVDFFISRAGADAAFAAEIGRILEDDGKSVVLQQWDFANRNFMERMHWALGSGARVVALLSGDYLSSAHCEAEWQNTIAHDPLNRQGRLIVMRVDECVPTGLLTALAYWDLVPIRDDRDLVRDIVLAAIKPGRHKPDGSPVGPYWREARAIVHQDIRPTPSFTGREAELSAIDAALTSGGAAAVTQPAAVHGLGGIGKSVLAREYAHRFQDRYAGVWWLNAAKPKMSEGFEGVETALVELGAIFIRGLDQAQDREKAARHTLQFLADGGFEKPWLLVFDNVDDARVLREWAPQGNNAHFLLTTRLSGWPGRVRAIEIEEWPMPDAISYLLRESGREDLNEADAEKISEALGRLPLALSHAAAYLRSRQNVTAASYLANLRRRMSDAPRDAEYDRAVFATFQQALDEADSEAPGARAVLSLAAFFAPDDIPEDLFRQPSSSYPEALADLLADPGATDDAIGALAQLSLIDFDPARRSFSVHRLVQAATRDALATEAPTWAAAALRAVRVAFPQPEFNTWPVCERLVPHVRAVAAQVTTDNRELAWLLDAAASYLMERAALAEVLPLYKRSLAIFERFAAADPGNAGWQYDLGISNERIGDVLMAQGDLAAALNAYQAKQGIISRLAAADPGNAGWQRGLGVSHDRIGDVLVEQGDLAQALASYQASLAIAERLGASDPGNAGWQHNLSVSHNKIGDVLWAQGDLAQALARYQASLAIAERLADADPGNAGWQRDLSVSHDRIGDVLVEQGDLAQALASYQASLAIAERLGASDPGDAGWQRDLSISHNKIGDVLRAQGDLAQALASYQASLAIADRLAAADPGNAGWQRDLSIAQEKIGNVLVEQGDLAQALASYQASLAIRERLADADPGNAGWQRNLSISHGKIGDVLVEQGDLALALASYQASLAIAERLGASDPGNAGWQRDLSVSHNKIGDVLVEQGDLAQALASYQASLAIRERLGASDPGNAGWQRDLSVSHDRIGDVLRAQGDLAQALASYQASLAIAERLGASDPGNAGWQHDVALSLMRVGFVAAQKGERDGALVAYGRGLGYAAAGDARTRPCRVHARSRQVRGANRQAGRLTSDRCAAARLRMTGAGSRRNHRQGIKSNILRLSP
ncbi:tetratricopeptide repeat protein [Defluviicoccus vanus]|uniref:Tetratricopeptide repeat protein n=1 Tax=Defluviicoccus vanus TaxID=111831 RepID=A0A7H1MZG4_9PROT|nr:tetratricopeptide repeat protein [Defluviicoccus vanus]